MPIPSSIPDVLDVMVVRGERAAEGAEPALVIEIPHGATRGDDYRRLERELTSPLPASLIDFFYANTDAGAPELAVAVARRFVSMEPARSVTILRCLIPRTFIDCNRNIEASPADFKQGKVTPGLMPWIATPGDRALLRGRYDAYVGAVRQASGALGQGGAMLMLHSYAPRTVDVEVDLDVVTSIHRAYGPDLAGTWPLRPEVDVIGRDVEGGSHAPPRIVDALRSSFGALGIEVADSATYPLHPSTLAWEHVARHPGRALCVEIRRDLLADPFEPFREMRISEEKTARLAAPLAEALRCWW